MNHTKTTSFPLPKILFVIFFVILGFAFGIQAGYFNSQNMNSLWGIFKPKNQNVATTNQPQTVNNELIRVVSEESQVIDVVKKSAPAVVSVIASADVPVLEQCYKSIEGIDPFFGDFGGFDFRVPSVCQKGTQRQRVGAGSGFIVSSDGYILTNKHVVDNEKADYTVILNNEANKDEKVKATVLATDPSNDIAVLKIDKTSLPYLAFSDSSKLQVGQTAIAIGYALGEFDNTVSRGVVSGLARSIVAGRTSSGTSEKLEGIIQTDAAINPGNSGGPLLDIGGNVIGMNVAMAQAQSIGFAIPANDIKKVYEDVKATGKIQRAFLGIRYLIIDEDIQKKNNLPYNYGALVSRGTERGELAVVPGSPADKAGIVENDIVLEIDGIKLDNSHSLAQIVSQHKIGDTVKLKIYSKGQEKTVDVVLAEKKG